MYSETYLDKQINVAMREIEKAEALKHTPSGKLSAGALMEPLQWQVLKALGAGKREIDDYLLRKFLRGKQVEDWLVAHIPGMISGQEFVEYRGVVGYLDALVDTKDYDHKLGIIPHEIKSVTNIKFKYLKKSKMADHGHKLQGGLYALAKGSTHFAIDYVASDDLRVLTFVYSVDDVKDEINEIIDVYNAQMESETVPAFVAKFKWQASKEYNKFPEWQDLTEAECNFAINYHYPDAWKNYKEKNTKA